MQLNLYLEKSEFGALFEQAIAEAINRTSLEKYAIHNVFLCLDTTWHQFDHVLLLPHKIVVIEAKTTQAVQYDVHSTHDSLTYGNNTVRNYKGLVRQTNRMRRTLNALYGNEYMLGNVNIEIVGCVDADKVSSYQSNVTIYDREGIWYYISLLEKECQMYSEVIKVRAYQDLLSRLIPHFRSESDFKHQIMTASRFHNISMVINSKHADKVLLDYTLEDEPLSVIKNEIGTREEDFELSLRQVLGYLPDKALDVYRKATGVSPQDVTDYILAVESVLQSHEYLRDLFYNSDTFIGEEFISVACRNANISLSEFLYECVSYLMRVEYDLYRILLKQDVKVGYRGIDFVDVYNIIVRSLIR